MTFSLYIKKFFNLLSSKSKSQCIADHQQILDDLLALRKMLQILGNEDQSHNPEFSQQFSELWHNLIEDCNLVEQFLSKNKLQISQIKLFIEKVQTFPPLEEHPLGYYLNKSVGNEWLPFPFMDILHQLHQEHQEKPDCSQLQEWTTSLDTIILALEHRLLNH